MPSGISFCPGYSAPEAPTRNSSATAHRSIKSKSSSGSSKRLGIVSSSVASFLRNTMLGRAPTDICANKLDTKGFAMPGDDDNSAHTVFQRPDSRRSSVSQLTVCSQSSQRSHLAVRSVKSVYSVRSVQRSSVTPDIFVTHPTSQGRRSHIVHRTRSITRVPTQAGVGIRHVRYYHPSVTGIIPPTEDDVTPFTPSQETLQASSIDLDRASALSVPRTADIAKEFPGAVNVRQIARESALDLEHAKAVVDGLCHKPLPAVPVEQRSALDSYLSNRQFSMSADPAGQSHFTLLDNTAVAEEPAQEACSPSPANPSVRKHRRNALLSLCGGSDTGAGAQDEALPVSPTPRQRCSLRKSTPSGSFILAADGETFFDDREARWSYISVSSSYQSPTESIPSPKQPEKKLQYLAYSPALPFGDAGSEPSTTDNAASQQVECGPARSLGQLYDRMEKLEDGLEDGLEEGDGSLEASLRRATRVHSMILDATIQTFTRPKEKPRLIDIRRPKVPKRHSMLDNGFPLLNESTASFSAEPTYAKRTLVGDELKAAQKEARRKSGTQDAGRR